MDADPTQPTPQTREGVSAQGRLIDALAGDAPLSGTLNELAGRIGVSTGELQVALRELLELGWIFAVLGQDGRLTVGRERRTGERRRRSTGERRRAAARNLRADDISRL